MAETAEEVQDVEELKARISVLRFKKANRNRPSLRCSGQLTVLSFGGGQDSTCIFYKIIYDKKFREKYVKGRLLVIMADTGNEHSETYEHVKEIQSTAEKHNIEFVFLNNWAYTAEAWKGGLIEHYEQYDTVGSKAFKKQCSVSLKIDPIYNYVEQWIHNWCKTNKVGKKNAVKEFAIYNGKIRVLIGIAKGEESRVSKPKKIPQWQRIGVEKIYPLMQEGIDRQGAQDYIKSVGHKVPMPSNCLLCPFLSLQELLYLYRFEPYWYHKWVWLEENKLKTFKERGKEDKQNLTVWGSQKRLPEKLKEAQELYGHWTDDQLREYKMSHGHCVKTQF